MMTPVAQVWWLRPVSSAARVGEQRRRGVELRVAQAVLGQPVEGRRRDRPPNVDDARSRRHRSGSAGRSAHPWAPYWLAGSPGVESLTVRPMWPLNGWSGTRQDFLRRGRRHEGSAQQHAENDAESHVLSLFGCVPVHAQGVPL